MSLDRGNVSLDRGNVAALLGSFAALGLAYVVSAGADPGVLPWRAPDGRVVYQVPREGETWRLDAAGWVLVAPSWRTAPAEVGSVDQTLDVAHVGSG